MDMDLYARLHGLTGMVAKSAKSPPVVPEDTEFEKNLDAYANAAAEQEMGNFQPGLLSSQQTSSKIKQEIKESVHEFARSFGEGYKIISDAMATEGLEMPRVDAERLNIFNDPTAFSEALETGSQIYDLLGFSFENLLSFQKIAIGFFDKGEFHKACDSFFFLVTIASEMASFWNALAISQIQLQHYEKAEEALLNALELDPADVEFYLNCVHVYIKTKKFDEANKLCDKGIAYAIESGDEDWGPKLQELLNGVKEIIKQEYSM